MSIDKKTAEMTAERRARHAKRAAAALAATKVAAAAKPAVKPAKPVAKIAKPAVKAPVAAAAKTVAKPAAKPAKVRAELAEDGVKAADIMESLGEEVSPGVLVPEELAKQITDPEDANEDPAYTPGLLIPPDLEDVVTAVADPASFSVTEDTTFNLFPMFSGEAKSAAEILKAGAHWILVANGRPLAEIALKDQDNAAEIARHFVTADFGRSLIAGIQGHGLVEALKSVKAKAYVAVIDRSKRLQTERAKLQATAEETIRQKSAALKNKYDSMVALALRASANNVAGVENPLKDAFVVAVGQMGIDASAAADLVDNLFFTHGPMTFTHILETAHDWANRPEGEQKLVASIVDSTVRRPLSASVRPGSHAASNPHYNANLAYQMQANAAPVAGPAVAQRDEIVPAAAARTLSASTQADGNFSVAAYRAKFGSSI